METPEKKTWLKSDLLSVWIVFLTGTVIGLAFASWFFAGICLFLTILIGSADRSEAEFAWVHPDVKDDLLDRAGVNNESCLNPDNPVNAGRIKDPPLIG